MGCGSFCCRLLVRLEPDERPPPDDRGHRAGFVAKAADGQCVRFDRATGRCSDWEQRPRACREYDCNHDPLLQIVVREGFVSLTALVTSRRRVDSLGRVQVPAPGATDEAARLLSDLRRRLDDADGPDEVGPHERDSAARLRELKQQLAELIGRPRPCARCGLGLPEPAGFAAGGACCARPTGDLFDADCLAELRAGGVRADELQGPAIPQAGCVFRSPAGCTLAPHCRPGACASYACEQLELELRGAGRWDEIAGIRDALADQTARFRRTRALRLASRDVDGLL